MNNTAQVLQENKQQILGNWMKMQVDDTMQRNNLVSREELQRQSEELLTALLQAIKKGNFDNVYTDDYAQVNDILSDISVMRARQGFSPRETNRFVLSLKQALCDVLEQEHAGTPEVLYKEILQVNSLLDNLSIIAFETYIKGREDVILRQSDEINEISTPVIRVWEGILALPIIGTLDSSRTQTVMENLLQEIVETGSSIAILDISGVPTVDSMVAQHLIKTVSATRLMGAECIISGIRPEIAQTIVHLGIDLSNIVTKATLASALQVAFARLNLQVRSIDRMAAPLLK
ncbi:STAS domain-containing protein [Pontibacter sp. 172403-2]|uniref:STAS domain-containing protein n=1 Tax=Pontibacter rufus TaxID=2791028 RepID=UPI0018AFD28F|nr:STAS domain-containing protein [Pontibacter sp. 172403-2]MBF9255440.1 STAS domain-containing protein [Pontibacter sp. 172403-2]